MAAGGAPAGGANEAQVQTSFPLPPMYFRKYTNEAVMQKMTPERPPLPTDSYTMFGQTCHQDDLIIRPLELQGLERLHPQIYDRRKELKKLTVSILCNFLDLLDILIHATGSQTRDEKIEDLNMLFIHIHHLINEFRPHQARETLKVMLEMQQAQILDVGERLWKHIEKAGDILSKCSSQLAAMKQLSGPNAPLGTADLGGPSVLEDDAEINMDVDAENMEGILEKDHILAGLMSEIGD